MKYLKFNMQIELQIPDKDPTRDSDRVKAEITYAIQQQHPHWEFNIEIANNGHKPTPPKEGE